MKKPKKGDKVLFNAHGTIDRIKCVVTEVWHDGTVDLESESGNFKTQNVRIVADGVCNVSQAEYGKKIAKKPVTEEAETESEGE